MEFVAAFFAVVLSAMCLTATYAWLVVVGTAPRKHSRTRGVEPPDAR